jgi:putative Ca2+/H+ antiporter (TMEM165/GDT1 family)
VERSLFLTTFSLIFLSELPDKTALATVILSTRGNGLAVFIGAAAAFLVQSLVAVTFGNFMSALPQRWVHLAAGLLFLTFAAMAWRGRKRDDDGGSNIGGHESAATFWRTARTAFVVIFIAEWGDLTQLATASLTARYRHPLTIFTASVLALWSATALAIFVGNRLKDVIQPRLLERAAAVAFAAIGGYMVFSWANS